MLEPERLRPTLVPVLLRLREYAGDCEQTPDLTLENYLQRILDRLNIPGVDAYVLKNLKAGRCLVMFDGLDEVSDPIMRKKVQDTIKTFILDYRDVSEASYNRFFITSRVADYDQEAFPNYAHFTVAELRSEQIQNFLPRWCRASVRWSHSSIAAIGGHAEQNAAVTEQLCSPERCGGCIDRGDQVGRRFSRYPQSGGGRGREIFKPHS